MRVWFDKLTTNGPGPVFPPWAGHPGFPPGLVMLAFPWGLVVPAFPRL